jgi:hypothetical protein
LGKGFLLGFLKRVVANLCNFPFRQLDFPFGFAGYFSILDCLIENISLMAFKKQYIHFQYSISKDCSSQETSVNQSWSTAQSSAAVPFLQPPPKSSSHRPGRERDSTGQSFPYRPASGASQSLYHYTPSAWQEQTGSAVLWVRY